VSAGSHLREDVRVHPRVGTNDDPALAEVEEAGHQRGVIFVCIQVGPTEDVTELVGEHGEQVETLSGGSVEPGVQPTIGVDNELGVIGGRTIHEPPVAGRRRIDRDPDAARCCERVTRELGDHHGHVNEHRLLPDRRCSRSNRRDVAERDSGYRGGRCRERC
jgi:hypothetical protein